MLLSLLLLTLSIEAKHCIWTTLEACENNDVEIQPKPCTESTDDDQANAYVRYLAFKRKFKTGDNDRVCCSHELFWKLVNRAKSSWGRLGSDEV